MSLAIVDPSEITLRGVVAGFRRDRRFRITSSSTAVNSPDSTADVLSSDALLIDPVVAGAVQSEWLAPVLAAGCTVIIYSDYFEPQFFISALLSKVRGYIAKSDTSLQRLADLVWAIVRHEALVVDGRFADYFWARPEERVVLFAPDDTIDLTARQREVLALLAAGLTDGEVALRLGVSLSTVHTHILNIERKLGATSRFDLAVKAVRAGLINPSPPVLAS